MGSLSARKRIEKFEKVVGRLIPDKDRARTENDGTCRAGAPEMNLVMTTRWGRRTAARALFLLLLPQKKHLPLSP